MIAAVAIVVLGAVVTAAFALGPQGLELASWLIAPLALIVAVAALPEGTLRRLEVAPATVRRLVRALVSGGVVAGTFLCSGDAAFGTSLGPVTGVVLAVDSTGPVVVFGRASDGVGYCSRPDHEWESRWRGPNIGRDWHRLDDLTAFSSSYGGLEVVGRRADKLIFGYRDGENVTWHRPKRIGDGVSGSPDALELGATPEERRFVAFAPGSRGGVKVFERTDYEKRWPPQWRGRPTLVPDLGKVDGVAVAEDRSGGLVLLIRQGSRLLETHRAAAPFEKSITAGWSPARPLSFPAGVTPTATGDPMHAAVDDVSISRALRFAVPARGGIALLSTPDAGGGWQSEIVPLPAPPIAVAQLDTTDAGGDPTTVLAFVRDGKIYQMWRDEAAWTRPVPVTC